MYKEKKIAVVVPAYNEEALIGPTLADVPDFVDSIVVIDDASTDNTSTRVEEVARRDRRVTLIRHAQNQGVGGSIVDGYQRAIDEDRDIAVVMAGDNQMPPEYLPQLLDHLIHKGYDAAKGNRFLAAPTTISQMPKHRILGNIILTLLTKLASGYWSIFDTQNGYWAITVDSLKRLDLSRISKRYDLENSMLIHMNIINARIADVPVPAVYGGERSNIRVWRDVPRILFALFTGFWQRIYLKYVLYNFHPVALFLFSGLPLVLWGVGFGIWAAINSIGPESASTGTVMLSVLPFLVGFQLLLAALVLDMINEPK
jgi:glycosyltransferase involved in cell wall biosynthesis